LPTQWAGYKGFDKNFPHATVDHAKRQYVVGAVHTQTIEGFWSIFKRGIVGSFHKVSAKYLPLYVAEFQFRYNKRFNTTFSEQRLRAYEAPLPSDCTGVLDGIRIGFMGTIKAATRSKPTIRTRPAWHRPSTARGKSTSRRRRQREGRQGGPRAPRESEN
jgi:ISXO2-like transposase domain